MMNHEEPIIEPEELTSNIDQVASMNFQAQVDGTLHPGETCAQNLRGARYMLLDNAIMTNEKDERGEKID